MAGEHMTAVTDPVEVMVAMVDDRVPPLEACIMAFGLEMGQDIHSRWRRKMKATARQKKVKSNGGTHDRPPTR